MLFLNARCGFLLLRKGCRNTVIIHSQKCVIRLLVERNSEFRTKFKALSSHWPVKE